MGVKRFILQEGDGFMPELKRIGDLARKYDISNRTLRYYEELGLLESIRDRDSQYRYYDEKAIEKLEQILILRKLEFSVKEIKLLFSSPGIETAVSILKEKLGLLVEQRSLLERRERALNMLLRLLQESVPENLKILKALHEKALTALELSSKAQYEKEVKKMANEKIELPEVRIIELKPTKVAYYRVESESPELDAWKVLLDWAKEKGLIELPTTRYFGFDNPPPSPGKSVYGYEVWITIPEDCEPSGEVKLKNFSGGLYAVTSTYLPDIGENWKRLVEWVKTSEYELGAHQCLEETISPQKMPNEQTQFDLYCPISVK